LKGLLGGAQIPHSEADLTHLVEAISGKGREPMVDEFGTRPLGLLLGFCPGSTQPDDLGAVDPAQTGKTADRLAFAPPLGCLGPLPRTAVLGELLTGADHVAVHDPGN
jgi:hypothetical protein